MSSEEGDFFFTCPTPRDPSCQEYLKLRQPSWHGSLTIHIKGRKMIWLASDYNGSESVCACVWVFSLRRWRNWLFSAFFSPSSSPSSSRSNIWKQMIVVVIIFILSCRQSMQHQRTHSLVDKQTDV